MNHVYKFPSERFAPLLNGIEKDDRELKRFFLKVQIKNRDTTKSLLVILKNPSRAGKVGQSENVSDKTVNTIGEYFYKRSQDIEFVTIMNLFPAFETDPKKLTDRRNDLICERNKQYLKDEIEAADNVVVAWGSHPRGCKAEFTQMKQFVLPLLYMKKVFQMKKRSKPMNAKRPMHAQVWGYNEYDLEPIIVSENSPLY